MLLSGALLAPSACYTVSACPMTSLSKSVLHCGALLLFLTLAARGSFAQPTPHVADSPVVPFEELFEIEDTIRLDPSVLLGQVQFMDVNNAGEILVDDGSEAGIHLFNSSGGHVRSFSVSDCLPGEQDYLDPQTRFIGSGRIMTLRTVTRSAVIFDRVGRCVAVSRTLGRSYRAFCGSDDPVILHDLSPEGEPIFDTYNLSLELVETERLEPTPFPSLNVLVAISGLDMDCFDHGPYFVLRESMDRYPVRPREFSTINRPEFFKPRKMDVTPRHPNRSKMLTAYPQNLGVLSLDGTTRVVAFRIWDERWSLDDESGSSIEALSIASSVGLFPPRSTIPHVFPNASGNGYLYDLGDQELLPNGEYGNQVVVRYRFIPPARTAK